MEIQQDLNIEQTQNNEETSGARLRKLIQEYLKVTQTEFAREIGVSLQTITAYTSNVRNLGNKNIVRIVRAYPNVNSEYLRSGELPVFIDQSMKGKVIFEQIEELTSEVQELREVINDLKEEMKRNNQKELLFIELLEKFTRR